VMKVVIKLPKLKLKLKKLLKFSQKPIQSNHYGQSTRFSERNRILAQQFTFVTSFCLFDDTLSIYVPFVQNGIGFYHSNLLPLMLTAGIMGFLDIPLNRLRYWFSGAFGLSVDDTVRFLSQYREELKKQLENTQICLCNIYRCRLEHVLYLSCCSLGSLSLCCLVLEEQLHWVD
jgi:hypothetical protein